MENWFIPSSTLPPPPAARVLVLAPHPDDEIFGCGGILALYRQAGVPVTVLVLTDGAGYASEADRPAIQGTRQAETRAALAVLGITDVVFEGLSDRALNTQADLAERIGVHVRQHQADLLLAPSLWEVHPDHLATGRAAWAAATSLQQQGLPVPALLFYEVGSPQRVDRLVDITPVWGLKAQAMQCFGSQLAVQDYARHITALNTYRTYTLPDAVRYAEAFSLVTPTELASAARMREDPAHRMMSRWTELALAAATAHVETLQTSVVREHGALVQSLELVNQQLLARQNELADARWRLQDMTSSSSWRVTAPLRWLSRLLQRRG